MEKVVTVCFLMLTAVGQVWSSAGNVWTYRGALGPEHWHLDYPHCGGLKQSPISISTGDVIVDLERLTPIVFSGYDAVSNINYTLANNGHTVQVTLNEKKSEIRGGGLPGTYAAEQFHFHWGATDDRGSEHDVNGKHFPMEMHIVHHNKLYADVSEAMDKKEGLAVLGFFFEVGRFNQHFEEIITHFKDIQYKNNKVEIDSIPLVELMPASLSKFYRYEGSLTTPPCYESVIWTMFNQTIEIAEEQLEDFRTTVYENDESEGGVKLDISDDFRPAQCMYRRRVYASHPTLRYRDYVPSDADNLTDAAGLVLPSFTLLLSIILVHLISF